METKFTPAPWKVFQNGAGSWVVNCMGDCDNNEEEINEFSPTVADTWSVKYGKHEDKDPQANAHLIAAAPEMYEMLESLQEVFFKSDSSDSTWREIERLLEKARGNHE